MADLSALSAAAMSFKAAKEIAEGLVGLRDTALVESKAIELRSKILDAQSSVFQANEERAILIEQVHELEKKLGALNAWNTEKEKYELKEIVEGCFAYALKVDQTSSTPYHELCTSCFQNGKKSILQLVRRDIGRAEVKVCHDCGSEIYVRGAWEPEHGMTKSASRRRN